MGNYTLHGPKVSVIVPVYNTGELLKDTIEYILAQTYRNFELLLVDDGSTDASGAVCDAYAKTDARILALHKENGGICSARNHGLEHASGKYIAFCDHDDVMAAECLEKGVEALEQTGAEVVRFRRRHEIHSKRGVRYDEPRAFPRTVFEGQNWTNYLETLRVCGYGVWAGIYEKELLSKNNIRFDERARYGFEDHIFTARCCGAAKKTVLIPELLYTWIQREAMSTSLRNSEGVYQNRMDSILLWARAEGEVARKLGASTIEFNARKLEYLSFGMAEINRMNTQSIKTKREIYAKMMKEISFDNSAGLEYESLRKRILGWCLRKGALRTYCFLKRVQNIWNDLEYNRDTAFPDKPI